MLKKGLLFMLVVSILTTTTVMGTLFFKSIDPYNVVEAFEKGKINVVIDNVVVETDSYPILEENKILIPVDMFKDYIYQDVEVSEEYARLYVNIDNPQFQLENEALDQRIEKGLNLNFLLEKVEDKHYINIKGLEKLFGIEVTFIEDSEILLIDRLKESEDIAKIKKTTYLRPKKSSFGFKIDKLSKGDELLVIKDEGKWLKVRNEDGFIGYVLNKYAKVETIEHEVDRSLNAPRDDWNPKGKINMVWAHIGKYSPDLSIEDTIEGLDVIAPTWFSIVDQSGYVVNNGDLKYVEDAHNKGYRIWGLIDNSFDKDLTKGLLANEEAQERAINQILTYASIYNLDGINIDFENVYYEDKDRLTAFVDKLTNALKEQNLIVSMDMTVPSTSEVWSKFYDRKALSQILDYAIVMTYDEHWGSSPVSGSVASMGWVRRGIERTLQYVPHEKLIMGIPFYTREWEETLGANGKVSVKSKALSMEQVTNAVIENKSEVVWLDDIGQYYTEYTKEEKRYRIWIESDRSIELKAQLANEYDLAGVGSWRKGFEVESVWGVLNNVIKGSSKLVVE